LASAGLGIGAFALAGRSTDRGQRLPALAAHGRPAHFPPKAKRVIYLFQSGGPSQIDLFDYKPRLPRVASQRATRFGPAWAAVARNDVEAVELSHRRSNTNSRARTKRRLGKRTLAAPQLASSIGFVSSSSMFTEAINHDPAIHILSKLGRKLPGGRVSDLAVVWPRLGESGSAGFRRAGVRKERYPNDQPLYDRLWGSGFLPTKYQGVKFRSTGDPVLFLSKSTGYRCGDTPAKLDDLLS